MPKKTTKKEEAKTADTKEVKTDKAQVRNLPKIFMLGETDRDAIVSWLDKTNLPHSEVRLVIRTLMGLGELPRGNK